MIYIFLKILLWFVSMMKDYHFDVNIIITSIDEIFDVMLYCLV